jgi:hypothetical protein
MRSRFQIKVVAQFRKEGDDERSRKKSHENSSFPSKDFLPTPIDSDK